MNRSKVALSVFALITAAAANSVAAAEITSSYPMDVAPCGGASPACDPAREFTVSTDGVLRAKVVASAQNCDAIDVHFSVDGTRLFSAHQVTPGTSTGIEDLGPVGAGTHTLTVQAEEPLGIACDSRGGAATLSITASAAADSAAIPRSGDSSGSATRNPYLVTFKGSVPRDLSKRVRALGGLVIDTFQELKVVLIADLTDDAAIALAAQSDVADVTRDAPLSPDDPGPVRHVGGGYLGRTGESVPAQTSVADPTTAIAYPYQWNMRAIKADQAWAAGHLGSPDVRIAIIDSGMDPTHPDLAELIDHSRSISFCSTGENNLIQQEFPGYPPWTDLSGHGTWVASIAASKGVVTAGVTSRTTLMAVKRGCSVGPFPGFVSTTVRAIVYAADNGADVISMSIGQPPQPKRLRTTGGLIPLITAVRYALQNGVSAVVVGAGNDAIDLDHNGDDLVLICDIPGVICVSATGPTDFGPQAQGPWLNIDASAFYTNIGRSAISVAAPGGNLLFDPPCRGTFATCLSRGNVIGAGTLFAACATTDRRFDAQGNLVLGICSRNGFLFVDNFGTSASAPHVAGLAALLVSQLGRGNPAQIRSALVNSVDDLGQPGPDPFYGRGRINVVRALGVH